MKWTHLSVGAALVAALVGATQVRADDVAALKQTARDTAKKTSKAVVTARLVLKIQIGEREQEQKIEITGTVIDPSGLTVVPASALDPVASFRGRRGGGGGGGEQMRIESEVSETALVLEDGTEMDADVVLKDQELDLAFIKPHDASAKLDFVDLKAGDRTPQVLDDIFVVGRLNRAANRAVSVGTGEIRAVVKGPRTFYVTDNEVSIGHAGCVAYAADGTPIGIFATRRIASEGTGGGGFRGGRGGEALIVIRPIADVLELAKQAKDKKVEKKDEKKSDDKKDEKKPDDKKAPDGKKKGDDF